MRHHEQTESPKHHQERTQHHDGGAAASQAQQDLAHSSNHWMRGNERSTQDLVKQGALPAVKLHEFEQERGMHDYGALKKEQGDLAASKKGRDDDALRAQLRQKGLGEDINRKTGEDAQLQAGFDAAYKWRNTGTGLPWNRDLTRDNINDMLKDKNIDPKTKENVQALAKAIDDGSAKDLVQKDGSLNPDSVKKGMDARKQKLSEEGGELGKASGDVVNTRKTKQDADDRAQGIDEVTGASKTIQDASKLKSGEGYFQVAERMLGTDGQQHSVQEVKQLQKALQEQVAAEHGGHLPKHLKSGDQLVTEKNFKELMDRIQAKVAPPAIASHGGKPAE